MFLAFKVPNIQSRRFGFLALSWLSHQAECSSMRRGNWSQRIGGIGAAIFCPTFWMIILHIDTVCTCIMYVFLYMRFDVSFVKCIHVLNKCIFWIMKFICLVFLFKCIMAWYYLYRYIFLWFFAILTVLNLTHPKHAGPWSPRLVWMIWGALLVGCPDLWKKYPFLFEKFRWLWWSNKNTINYKVLLVGHSLILHFFFRDHRIVVFEAQGYTYG